MASWLAISGALADCIVYEYTRLSSGASKVLNVNDVTIPKAAPAPRRDQNRSVFSVAEAVTVVLFARTT